MNDHEHDKESANQDSTRKKKTLWARFLSFVRVLPVVGNLPNCTLQDHASALKEFGPTVLFATATFWFTAFILGAFTVYSDSSSIQLLYETTKSGQLFIFSVGMLGPILIVSAVDGPNTRQFPGRLGHLALILVLGAFAAGFHALALVSKENADLQLVDAKYLYTSSLVIAACVVILRYLTTVYRKSTTNPDPEKLMKGPEKSFAEAFAARHEVNPLSMPASPLVGQMMDRFNGRTGND